MLGGPEGAVLGDARFSRRTRWPTAPRTTPFMARGNATGRTWSAIARERAAAWRNRRHATPAFADSGLSASLAADRASRDSTPQFPLRGPPTRGGRRLNRAPTVGPTGCSCTSGSILLRRMAWGSVVQVQNHDARCRLRLCRRRIMLTSDTSISRCSPEKAGHGHRVAVRSPHDG
jgi:hypothetical protein